LFWQKVREGHQLLTFTSRRYQSLQNITAGARDQAWHHAFDIRPAHCKRWSAAMTSDQKPILHPDILKLPPQHHDQQTPSQYSPDRGPVPAQRIAPYRPPIDPRKWHLDENTGEYLRIKHHGGNRVLVDPTTYGDRWKESVLAGQELLLLAGVTLGLLTGGVVLWAIAENTRKPDCILPGSFAIICLLSAGRVFIELFAKLVREGFRDLGPEPVAQRPRREEAERQQVHGAGRFMNRDEIHRAASGETAFPGGEQHYED
jgi:hypothetical protein